MYHHAPPPSTDEKIYSTFKPAPEVENRGNVPFSLLNCILARRDFPDKNFPWCH
jgi:hypothetical protein